jgi:hypothetical protein
VFSVAQQPIHQDLEGSFQQPTTDMGCCTSKQQTDGTYSPSGFALSIAGKSFFLSSISFFLCSVYSISFS